jgi:hypothetical protein
MCRAGRIDRSRCQRVDDESDAMCGRFVQPRSVTELAACSAHPSPRICLHHVQHRPQHGDFGAMHGSGQGASVCAAPLRAHHQLRQGSRHWPPPSMLTPRPWPSRLSPKSLLDPTGWLLRLAVDSKRQIASPSLAATCNLWPWMDSGNTGSIPLMFWLASAISAPIQHS